jgi:hypothetical protein
METGTISGVTHGEISAPLMLTYTDPVVFLTVASFNGGEPVVPRITDIAAVKNVFSVIVSEFESYDGSHANGEVVNYAVIDAGTYTLSTGQTLVVGKQSVSSTFDGTPDFTTVDLDIDSFKLFTQIQSSDTAQTLATRTEKGIGEFDVSLMVQQSSRNDGNTITAEVGFMAVGAGTTSNTAEYPISLYGKKYGKFVRAKNGGGSGVVADAKVIGSWESFTLAAINPSISDCIQNGDTVSIKTVNGNYFSADNKKHLGAAQTYVGSWEKFTLKNMSHSSGCLQDQDQVSFKDKKGQYFTSHDDDSLDMHNGNSNEMKTHFYALFKE